MSQIDATIRLLLEDFHQTILPAVSQDLVKRDLSLGSIPQPKVGSMARVITGMRRSGKTFRLYQEILSLIESGIEPSRICYFNFDDDRLRPYENNLIGHVLEVFFEMNPQARSLGVYVFFDELQDVEGWGIAARRILDTEKVALYITGSSSRLLSEDVATEFRGRSVAYELQPLSFREYLRAREIEPAGEKDLFNKTKRSLWAKSFREYLVEGGFPAVQGLDERERVQVLQSYTQLTVARDVIERNKLSNATYTRNLARTAITSSAREVSVNRLANKSKEQGYSPGRAKISEILDAFEDAHLSYQVYDFSYSAQKIRLGGMKLYAADPGLYWATIPATNDGLCFALETAVYLELRRRRTVGRLGDIAMLKLPSGKEVDFIEGDALSSEAYQLIQVSLDMEQAPTRKREIEALREAMGKFGLDKGAVVTLSEEGEEPVPEGVIEIVPAWKWFLH